MLIKRFLLSAVLFLIPLWAHADWAADRDASAGYVTVTTLATAVDEAVPFCVVYLSDLPADFHTAMTTASDTDGKTIRVSTSDGTTQLACVPIGVNTSTDTGCLIFLGTGMSASTDVDYRIYVGNAALSMPSASGGMGEQAVFAAYEAAYILNSLTDRTGNGFDLTAAGGYTAGQSTAWEGITGYDLDGTSGTFLYHNASPVSAWPATFEVGHAPSTSTTTQDVMSIRSSSSTSPLFIVRIISSNVMQTLSRGDTGSLSTAATSNTLADTTWGISSAIRDAGSGTGKAILDAGTAGTDTTTIDTALTCNRFTLGASRSTSNTGHYDGKIGWALVSAANRSADYIATMQDNWAGTMYSAGAWTPLDSGCTSGSTGFVLFGAITQTTTAAVNWANITDAIVDDANTADVSLDETTNIESEQLLFSDIQYGTTVPTGADSYTITIRVKIDTEGGGKEINDLLVKFRDDTGTNVGDNLASATQWPSSPGTRDYVVTGYTPDGTEFDADAGLAFSATGFDTAGSTLAEVYVAWIKIDWQCGDDAAKSRGFFALTE